MASGFRMRHTRTGATPHCGCRTVAAVSKAQFSDPHVESKPIHLPDEPTGPRPADRADGDRPGSSRRRLVILGSLLAVGLAGAATLGTAAWRVAEQKDATLHTPARVAGLDRDDSEQARATADFLHTAVAAEIQFEQSISVVYADPTNPEARVLLFGGTVLLWQPARDLDRLFELVGGGAEAVTDVREVPAGELGGVMKCGTSLADSQMPVCGWADHGTVVMALFPGRSLEDAATLLRDIRVEIQSRR